MPFLLLGVAILLEVLATSFITTTDGFTRLLPTAAVLATYAASFALLANVVRDIPVGVAYALWSGLGTVTVVAIAVAFTGEAVTVAKILGVLLVVSGAVVLNLGGAH